MTFVHSQMEKAIQLCNVLLSSGIFPNFVMTLRFIV